MVMRHTERLDDFFPDWITRCERGYRAYDLNMPMMLPIKRPLQAYQGDPPITNTGDILARIIARGMFSGGYVPDIIYTSPALRCIQTANAMRSILRCDAKIRVEPGLFEYLALCPHGVPQFATPEERAQFHVDERYRPYMQISDLGKTRETVADYNTRTKNTLMRIAKLHEVSPVKKDQIVLIVAHASTVDLAGGLMARSRRSTEADFFENTKKIPYGSLLVLERVQGRRGWTPNLYAVPRVTYRDHTTEFDSAFVLREAPKVKN
ncbi:phosphoglycerate mutase family protein [Ancylostoma duodenale]|uniref:Phosphoglycerate mutase family protein n=1 Tax=Ancylostoma duodenale TaxID=51022 RepID=A0A0C2HD05_9BILA|nr:phosphoglycerate mutase family protein [Ancylostoma duodenale]